MDDNMQRNNRHALCKLGESRSENWFRMEVVEWTGNT